jgi:hypothetical protein
VLSVGGFGQQGEKFQGGRIMKKYFWITLLALIFFPVTGWGKTPTFNPQETISLVFSSNVHGELEPCG